MKNPFVFSHIVTDGYFCHRDELQLLKNYMLNCTNVVLFSKRRYGKSSLIKEIFKNHINQDEYLTIYFDIFDMSSSNDFAYSFYKAVAKSFKNDMQTVLQTLKAIFSRATFSATVTSNGEIEFKPSLAHQSFDETMEDIFVNLSNYLKKHNKKAIIAIDEFQQIAAIKEKNIEATLRTYIQNIDNIGFVFSGSKKHLLTQMFTNYAKPFYAQATPLKLGSIPKNQFYVFVAEKFEKTDKTIATEAFDALYEMADGESWLVQNICYHLWQSYKNIEKEHIDATINEIAAMSDGIYKMMFDNFSNTQKSALKIIVNHRGANLLSKEVLSLNDISKSSLVSALNVLLDREIIDKNENIYYINDKLFEIWLKSFTLGAMRK